MRIRFLNVCLLPIYTFLSKNIPFKHNYIVCWDVFNKLYFNTTKKTYKPFKSLDGLYLLYKDYLYILLNDMIYYTHKHKCVLYSYMTIIRLLLFYIQQKLEINYFVGQYRMKTFKYKIKSSLKLLKIKIPKNNKHFTFGTLSSPILYTVYMYINNV